MNSDDSLSSLPPVNPVIKKLLCDSLLNGGLFSALRIAYLTFAVDDLPWDAIVDRCRQWFAAVDEVTPLRHYLGLVYEDIKGTSALLRAGDYAAGTLQDISLRGDFGDGTMSKLGSADDELIADIRKIVGID